MSSTTTTEADPTDPEAVGNRRPGRRDRAQRTRALAALGAVLMLAGAAAWFWLERDSGSPDTRVTAGRNVAVNQDSSALSAHNSPTMVVSPVNPDLMVVTGRIDRPQFGAGIHVSADRGATWKEAALVLPAGKTRAFTPDVAMDARGNLYALFATMDGEAPSIHPGGLWLERSSDAGVSFSAPVQVAGPFAFQPRLAVDPTSGHVHVSWAQATPAVIQELAAASASSGPTARTPGFGPPPPIVMATSSDAGATFSAPVQVSEATRARVGAATPVVGRGGEVFVLYEDFGDDVNDFEGRPGPIHSGRFSLVLARSADRGKSFATRSVVEPGVVPSERFLAYLPKSPSLAVDAARGTMYVAWSDARNGDWDVFARRSDDAGETWSGVERVNDDKLRSGRHQYLPQIAVAPGGRVDVVYLDGKDVGNVLTAASLATSFDEGRTWNSVTASDALFSSQIGPRNEPSKADVGSRLGLVSTDTAAFAVWADTRRGSASTDKQDLVFAPIDFMLEQ